MESILSLMAKRRGYTGRDPTHTLCLPSRDAEMQGADIVDEVDKEAGFKIRDWKEDFDCAPISNWMCH